LFKLLSILKSTLKKKRIQNSPEDLVPVENSKSIQKTVSKCLKRKNSRRLIYNLSFQLILSLFVWSTSSTFNKYSFIKFSPYDQTFKLKLALSLKFCLPKLYKIILQTTLSSGFSLFISSLFTLKNRNLNL